MVKSRDSLRILLMQIRQSESVAIEEHSGFAKYSGLKKSQITPFNIINTPNFDASILAGFDALWVGGASDANVLYPQKYPFVESAKKVLSFCAEHSVPVFASCFGFQLAVLALKGEIFDSKDQFELGTLPISLTEKAQKDPLFYDTPNPFYAVSVHKQKALTAPPNTETLAYTDTCVHAFKLKNSPFWAFQFHPEVDKKCLIERLTIYQAKYTSGKNQLEKVLLSAQETPDSNSLLTKFVDRVLLA